MENLIKLLRENGQLIRGVSESQLAQIELFYNVKLPSEYKEFLKAMGISAGDFLLGSDCFYDRIYELRVYAQELLEEDDSSFELKQSHFVFYSHQGCSFAFFDASELLIESIWFYDEGGMEPTRRKCSLIEFLKERSEMDFV